MDFLHRRLSSCRVAPHCAVAALALGLLVAVARCVPAQTTVGSLSNFDVVNDTGGECHGFEIELDGLSSKDVTFTFGAPYQRYGNPQIVDGFDAHGGPAAFVRYESPYNPGAGTFVQATPVAPAGLLPGGHDCYTGGPIVSQVPYDQSGCEHFGVGITANPTNVVYRWLIADPLNPGKLQPSGTNVSIPAPVWNVLPPPAPGLPQVIQAVIPKEPPEDQREFGEAQWAKVFVTESPEPQELHHLLSDDPNMPDKESGEVEIEWVLLQFDKNKDPQENELANEKPLGDGKESVTRRYEFYKYIGMYDQETHEALCEDPTKPAQQVPEKCGETGPSGDWGVGEYIGAQMAAINVDQGLAVLDKDLPHGHLGDAYPDRPLVFGGTGPYTIKVTGDLPPGFDFDLLTGILSGTPTAGGTYTFTVDATDSLDVTVSQTFTLVIESTCVGACGGGDQVQAGDLIRLVHDALGDGPTLCQAGNPGGGAVTIDVVMTAMQHHMMGHCPMM
jgi:hypothetical protein